MPKGDLSKLPRMDNLKLPGERSSILTPLIVFTAGSIEAFDAAFNSTLPIFEMEAGTFKREVFDSYPFTTTASNVLVLSVVSCDCSEKEISIEKTNSILFKCVIYFLMYITSLINLTVLETSGKYAATRFGA